ncbi:MAG: low specificity L-threonine aldolase [bacterium]|nr:low specificity L-threonine aldolase [bacterium]
MNFASDNVVGAAPEILAAIVAANEGSLSSYGDDPVTTRMTARFDAIFERKVAAFPVGTGTAANALALAALTPPHSAIFCHAKAHIQDGECGAPEFYTGGAKLLTLPGEDGKIAAATLQRAIAEAGVGSSGGVPVAAVSITQASEAGTLYSPAEIRAIAEIAHRNGLSLHMDGARFANAVAALGLSPAEITWRVGVDVLSFGATKNGAMGAEAVVFFEPARGSELPYRRKRAGHLFSKQRFLAAQLEAYLTGDLWLRNARHANRQAARLAGGLRALPGFSLRYPAEANIVHVEMPEPAIRRLQEAGAVFHRRGGPDSRLVRLVTAFDTRPEDVERFIEIAGVASVAR